MKVQELLSGVWNNDFLSSFVVFSHRQLLLKTVAAAKALNIVRVLGGVQRNVL